MATKREYLDKEKFEKQLRTKLYAHRRELGLNQLDAGELIGKSRDTYQRWESTGQGLTNIYDISSVFHEFHFSLTEIMELMKLPQPTKEELEGFYSNIVIQGEVNHFDIYRYVSKNCADMDTLTIIRLLYILCKEYVSREQSLIDTASRKV